MGKQNDAFTAYLGRAEVLADLYNGCLYQGEEVVQAGNLCEVQQFYQQRLSERVKRPTARRRERDAIRAFWNEKSYVLLAAEAQNQPHLTMPFRCMEYDLAEYARQLRYIRLKSEGKLKTGVEYLSKMGRNDHLTPIVTIVLYHGTEPWDAPKKLSEMMELEEIDLILKQMVQEYQIYVFSVGRIAGGIFPDKSARTDWFDETAQQQDKNSGILQKTCRSDQQNGRSDLRYDLRDVKSERTTGQERKISGKRKGVY